MVWRVYSHLKIRFRTTNPARDHSPPNHCVMSPNTLIQAPGRYDEYRGMYLPAGERNLTCAEQEKGIKAISTTR